MGEITAERCEAWIEAVQENSYRYGDELTAILRAHAAAIRECDRLEDEHAAFTDTARTAFRILTILRGQQP